MRVLDSEVLESSYSVDRGPEELKIELGATSSVLRLQIQIEILESAPDSEVFAHLVVHAAIDLDEVATVLI